MKIYSIGPSRMFTAKQSRNMPETLTGGGIAPFDERDIPPYIMAAHVGGVRRIGKNSFITVMGLTNYCNYSTNLNETDCRNFKQNGIKRIIDLTEDGDSYLKHCSKEAGLEYTYLRMYTPWAKRTLDIDFNSIFEPYNSPKDKAEIKNFTDNFVKLIKLVQDDNVVVCTDYSSCIHPNCGTSAFNNFIKAFGSKNLSDFMPHVLIDIAAIYSNLSENDKRELGFTPETMRTFERELPL